jgi:hypothetical protein
MPLYLLNKSDRKGKRFALKTPEGKTLHFGSDVGRTFIDHGDMRKKLAWIARHKNDKGFNDPNAGIYYSRHLLWGEHDNIFANIKSLNKRDNVDIKVIEKIKINK